MKKTLNESKETWPNILPSILQAYKITLHSVTRRSSFSSSFKMGSLLESNHFAHLVEMFEILYTYHMKLNLSKCAFRVFLGKFLNFMVNKKGTEVNPDKIRAILEIEAPRTLKKVQRLTRRLVILNCFVCKPLITACLFSRV